MHINRYKKTASLVLFFLFVLSGWPADVPVVRNPPKLIVVITIDQFRYDYLTRFMSQYTGGFKRLWTKGAVFTNAQLQHFPTVTAVGHATLLSGATPNLSGIVNNEWYDQGAGRQVNSVQDPKFSQLGGKGPGASPSRMLVSTVGDELKLAAKGPSKVIGISLKDRAAILPVGHMADGAYWFDPATGNMVSSTFYFPELPGWVKSFNDARQVDKCSGLEWKSSKGEVLATLPKELGQLYYSAFEETPMATDLLLNFARQAIENEKLGVDDATDLLSVSLSSTDLLGHDVGPYSKEIQELHLQTDRQLGQFFSYLDKRSLPGSVLVVFTADHGVGPLAEYLAARKMPGGRLSEPQLRKTVEAALNGKYGEGKWIDHASFGGFWLNRATIRDKKLPQAEVEDTVAAAVISIPHVYRVYTATQLLKGQLVLDRVGRRVANGFYPGRSADVITLLEPYYVYGTKEASHGTAFVYDSHLPLIFMGPGIRPGKYHMDVAINDIAPTLATMLEIETPGGSVGRALHEMLMR